MESFVDLKWKNNSAFTNRICASFATDATAFKISPSFNSSTFVVMGQIIAPGSILYGVPREIKAIAFCDTTAASINLQVRVGGVTIATTPNFSVATAAIQTFGAISNYPTVDSVMTIEAFKVSGLLARRCHLSYLEILW